VSFSVCCVKKAPAVFPSPEAEESVMIGLHVKLFQQRLTILTNLMLMA